MKNKHEGCEKGFTHLSKAWYGEACLKDSEVIDKITIGFYAQDGGTSGEFCVAWEGLAGRPVPRLCVYDDGWSALNEFSDLIKKMADFDGQDISPEEFADLLLSMGIKDRTKTDEA